MTLDQRGGLAVARFFEAVAVLEDAHSMNEILHTCGIDKRNFYKKRKGVFGNVKIPVSWLSVMCVKYNVSALWLLTGKGEMFEV